MYGRLLFSALFACAAACTPLPAPGPHDHMRMDKLVDQGTAHLRAGLLEQAEAAFQVALEIGQSAAALDGLGCVAFMQGDYKEAEEYFWRAYEVDSSYNNSLGNLALLLEARGATAEARGLYEKSLQLDPYNFRSRNNYAVFLARNGGVSARDELHKAHELSNHPVIKENLRLFEER